MGGIVARIRSIKPEFWRDEKIATLKNKLAGYFFIALWNIADDEGKFIWNSKSLSLECPIFRSKEVVTYLSELSEKGLIQKSTCSGWGLITNWHHQKIDKPKVPKVKREEIQWLTQGNSSISRDSSRGVDARIGSRIKDQGSDQGSDQGPQKEMSTKKKKPKVTNGAKNADLVEAAPVENIISIYCDAWKSRYAINPIIQGKDAGRLSRFSRSIGYEKAKKIIFAYLDMPDQWFLTKRHDVDTMLGNLNAITLFEETGKVVSRKEIQNLDSLLRFKNLINDIEENGI